MLTTAFMNFFNSLACTGVSVFHSVLAVFQAILALLQQLIQTAFQLVQAFVQLGIEIFQGVFGFLTANFVVIALVGGVYYWYTRTKVRKVRVGTAK